MKFTVTTPVPDNTPADSYMVEILLGMGDADGESGMSMGPFKRGAHEASLESLLGVLERIDAAFPGGMGGDDNYNHIPGYTEWFNKYHRAPEALQEHYPEAWASATREEHARFSELAEGFYKAWPSDPMTDYHLPQYLKSYKVFYYDANHVKHNVEVDWEN